VWFGEVPYDLEDIDEVVEKADLAIVVGTSSTVRRTENTPQLGPYSDGLSC
jgi:NAD-dependent SIR2 family protein deacetylase